jgi:hypothetical protein
MVDKTQVQVARNLSANITVRLTPELLNQLKGQAQQVGVGPSTLARMWILERLHEVNRPRVGSE